VKALVAAGGGSLALRVRQGDQAAIEEALAALGSRETELAKRIDYARLFGEVHNRNAADRLLEIVESADAEELVAAALASLSSYADERIGRAVLARLPTFGEELQSSGLALLASRAEWATQLVAAIEEGRIEIKFVPAEVLRRMNMHHDTTLRERIARLWPDIGRPTGEAISAGLNRATAALDAGDFDPYRGHAIFQDACAKCHVLFREGGRIGPDLTSHPRDDAGRMLLSVVNPSLEIREGFETWVVTTDDGRVLSGFLFDQDANVVVLRGADGQNVSIPREAIEEMAKSPASLMPEGLLDNYSDQEIRDLFSYLRLSQPLNE
jgi:putative heme-binding domain-containing protein